jgi:methylglutamate dehydrogenase subunit D
VLKDTSALSLARGLVGTPGAAARPLRIGESRDWQLTQIAGFRDTTEDLEAILRTVMKVDIPSEVGEALTSGEALLLKTGPHRFWALTRDGADLASVFDAALVPEVGGVTRLSHSRTCLWVEGDMAADVLASGIALDFSNFSRVNYFALTGLHHTPLMVYRRSQIRYDLFVMRTFALWTWQWLLDAALPYGYEICGPPPE